MAKAKTKAKAKAKCRTKSKKRGRRPTRKQQAADEKKPTGHISVNGKPFAYWLPDDVSVEVQNVKGSA